MCLVTQAESSHPRVGKIPAKRQVLPKINKQISNAPHQLAGVEYVTERGKCLPPPQRGAGNRSRSGGGPGAAARLYGFAHSSGLQRLPPSQTPGLVAGGRPRTMTSRRRSQLRLRSGPCGRVRWQRAIQTASELPLVARTVVVARARHTAVGRRPRLRTWPTVPTS